MTNQTRPRVTSLAPQFLVDDLERSIAYYQRLGFKFGEPWGGFYAIGCIEAFYEQCVANGAKILKPLEATPWGTKDFYIEDNECPEDPGLRR
jgi:catechol 2,3-dioxygenase-like lactoylglutathione lyase family enzyme